MNKLSLVLLLSFCYGCLSFQLTTRPLLQSHTAAFAREKSKWDDLVDDDEFYDAKPPAPDMDYVPRNLIRQSLNFQEIRKVGGKDTVNDIYIQEPGTDVFWYIGKIARADISLEKAVARQWYMIERHAINLRPIELKPHWGKLDIWAAPGDSELDVAYNRASCKFQKMEREVEGARAVKSSALGFQGEAYDDNEEGFRTWRNDDGTPARPEISAPTMEDATEKND